jgi:D-amino-acid dehydrogenase
MQVTVVGSGVAGASTAFALAWSGVDVTIIDAGHLGQATAAGAGIVQPWSTSADGPVYDLYAAGADYYPTLLVRLAETGVPGIGYQRSGSLVVDPDPAQLDEVEQRVRRRAADGAAAGTVDRLDPDAARTLFPPLAPDLGAVHIGGGARVDGRLLRDGLLSAAQRRGAQVVRAEATLAATPSGAELRVAGQRVDCDAIVLAAGAWTNQVLEPLGITIPVIPQRGQIAHLLLAGVDTSDWPSVLPLGKHYLVPFAEGRVVVGATREDGSGFDPRVTAAGLREVLGEALEVAPGLADATVLETRVGLRPLGDNQQPVIGGLPDHPGLFVNAGFGASGLTMAPVVGAALAEQIVGNDQLVDLSAFAPS